MTSTYAFPIFLGINNTNLVEAFPKFLFSNTSIQITKKNCSYTNGFKYMAL